MKRILTLFTLLLFLMATALLMGVTGYADPLQSKTAVYTVSDVQTMQRYLLQSPAQTETGSADYDANEDGVWNGLDLGRMRQDCLAEVTTPTSNILVAYFSATGNTAQIADHIATATGADVYEITPAVPYTAADLNYQDSSCRANQEQADDTCRPAIAGELPDLSAYDVVFLGYPIWWGEEPRIIDTFLTSADFSAVTLVPFCTSGSSGIAASESRIAGLGVPIGQQLAGRRFAASVSEETVAAWIETLALPQEEVEMKLQLEVNGHILTATLADNTSVDALVALLETEPLTIEMHDYGDFEKVGTLPQSLPRNDEPIDTDYGDLILYQGNQFVLYYDTNSWTFTRLGHVDDVTKAELQEILGEGDVTMTLSLVAA